MSLLGANGSCLFLLWANESLTCLKRYRLDQAVFDRDKPSNNVTPPFVVRHFVANFVLVWMTLYYNIYILLHYSIWCSHKRRLCLVLYRLILLEVLTSVGTGSILTGSGRIRVSAKCLGRVWDGLYRTACFLHYTYCTTIRTVNA